MNRGGRNACPRPLKWQCHELALVLQEAEAEGPEENTPEKSKKKRALEEISSFELPDTPACTPAGLTEAAEGCSPCQQTKIKASLGLLAKRPAGKQKKPAAMPVKAQKKKAAAVKMEPTAEEKKNLHLMTYKGTGAVAVRVRQGRQLLQVKASTLEESKNLAEKLLEKLKKGSSLKDCLALKEKLC